MNYWFWLLIIVIPVIVFSVKPEASMRRRAGRLALAVGFGYVFLNLSLHLNLDRKWEAYKSCRYEHSGHDGPYELSLAQTLDKICPPKLYSGAQAATYFVVGWIPAAGYTGLWELIWRTRYRAAIRELSKAFKGKWVSNAVIMVATAAAYPTWILLSRLSY